MVKLVGGLMDVWLSDSDMYTYTFMSKLPHRLYISTYFYYCRTVVNREKEEIGYSYYSKGHDTIYRDTTLGIQNPLKHGFMGLMDIHVIVHNKNIKVT